MVQARLLARGIQTGIHYPTPVHLLPAYADLGYKAGAFPHSEEAADEVLSLPMFPELTASMQEQIAEAMINCKKSYYRNKDVDPGLTGRARLTT
jgi:dTDP-4-amino-4,6-dideoxygalactose transaminase